MGFLSWIQEAFSTTDTTQTNATDSTQDENPCSVSGHNYADGETKLYGTFARRRSGFSKGTTFNIYRKYFNYCSKCDDFEMEEEKLGKVSVDADGNLSVK